MSEQNPNIRRRQQRPSEYPTSESFGHQNKSDGKRSAQNQNRRRQPPEQNMRRKILLLLSSLTGLAVWYMTPVSNMLTTFLVHQVPVEADVSLGQAALAQFEYKTIYHPYWSPIVEQVGQELIATLESSSVDILEQAGGNQHWVEQGVMAFLDEFSSHGYRSMSPNLKNYQWDFGVVSAPIVNAFALPGGFIRVTDKLLETLSPTRGELASLLGHEVGHALFRHSQKRIVQQKMFQLVLSTLTYEDNDEYDENFGEAMGELLVKSAQWFGQQKFSRDDEYQADATGWALLQNSHAYNPQSVQSLLTKLWTLQGQTPTTLDWMDTHPATESRIEALKEKWEQLNRREKRRLEHRPI